MYPVIAEDVLYIEEGELIFAVKPLQEVAQLNNTASLIWKLCNGNHTIQEILELVAERNGKSFEETAKLVVPFLRDLNSQGYLAFAQEPFSSRSPEPLDWWSKPVDEFLSEYLVPEESKGAVKRIDI
jgi:hypothetical protein